MNVNNKNTKEINSKYGIVYERDENGNLVMKNGIRDDTVVVNKVTSTKIASINLEMSEIQNINDDISELNMILYLDNNESTLNSLIPICYVYINRPIEVIDFEATDTLGSYSYFNDGIYVYVNIPLETENIENIETTLSYNLLKINPSDTYCEDNIYTVFTVPTNNIYITPQQTIEIIEFESIIDDGSNITISLE